MMKVIKVVVDELPSGCLFCDFSTVWDSTKSKCRLANKRTVFQENKTERPDWCPLMTQKE